MYLTKMLKKLVTALCLLAVVGMFAACSNASSSSDSSSDDLNSDEQYTVLYRGEEVFGGTVTGKDFLLMAEMYDWKAGTDYKVDNSKKTITLTNSGVKKLSETKVVKESGESGINARYYGTKDENSYVAEFKGEELTEKINGEVVKQEISGTFKVYQRTNGNDLCVCEGTFKDGNPEDDCTIKIEITKIMSKHGDKLEPVSPTQKSDLTIKDGEFTYNEINFSRNRS